MGRARRADIGIQQNPDGSITCSPPCRCSSIAGGTSSICCNKLGCKIFTTPLDQLPTGRSATPLTSRVRVSGEMGALYAGQMGASDRRQIVMTGTAIVQNIFRVNGLYTNDELAQDLTNKFTASGWDVNYIKITGGNTVAVSRTVNIQISANVLWNYTAADARTSAVNELTSFTWVYQTLGFPDLPIRPISNVALIVQSEEPRDSVLPTPDPAPKPDANKVPPGAPTTDLFSQIGTTLGFGGVGAAVGAATGGLLAIGLVLLLAFRQK